MYQNPNLPASRVRLATDAGRSAPHSAPRGGRPVPQALTLLTLTILLVGAVIYPMLVTALLTVALVAYVSRRFLHTTVQAHASDRESGAELNPTPAAESSS
jgi:hypothetical protein